MTINVYARYYAAECTYNGVQRRAARVMLISDSENGHIRYEAAVTFFPHTDDEDFAVSYDAYSSEILYDAQGRRSKKREEKLLTALQPAADRLAAAAGGRIFWDKPLRDAEIG